MAGEAADLIFTDPPYNVEYEGYTDDKLKIQGDRMSDADFILVAAGVSEHLGGGGLRSPLPDYLGQEHVRLGLGRYKFEHEPLFYCHVAVVDLFGGSGSTLIGVAAERPG